MNQKVLLLMLFCMYPFFIVTADKKPSLPRKVSSEEILPGLLKSFKAYEEDLAKKVVPLPKTPTRSISHKPEKSPSPEIKEFSSWDDLSDRKGRLRHRFGRK
jgi:hypothetical protein